MRRVAWAHVAPKGGLLRHGAPLRVVLCVRFQPFLLYKGVSNSSAGYADAVEPDTRIVSGHARQAAGGAAVQGGRHHMGFSRMRQTQDTNTQPTAKSMQ
jgi:hypothetical protein